MGTNGNGVSKFTPGDVAEVIALVGPGEEVPSGFKPFRQMRYNLVDGRVWYAPLKTGVKVSNLELAEGEPFRVCKRPFGTGSVIDVMRCHGQAAPTPTQLTTIDPGGHVLEAKLAASIAAAKHLQAQAAPPSEDPGPSNGRVSFPAPAIPVNGQG